MKKLFLIAATFIMVGTLSIFATNLQELQLEVLYLKKVTIPKLIKKEQWEKLIDKEVKLIDYERQIEKLKNPNQHQEMMSALREQASKKYVPKKYDEDFFENL